MDSISVLHFLQREGGKEGREGGKERGVIDNPWALELSRLGSVFASLAVCPWMWYLP